MELEDLKKFIKEEVNNLINETSNKNNNILYLHGLGSNPTKDKIHQINHKNYNIISPKLNYKTKKMWDYVDNIIKTKNPIAIIGHSFGGYLAYYLSNKHKIPALIFNPAFEDEELNLLPIPHYIKNITPHNKQLSVVGSKDTEIEPKIQKKHLKKGKNKIFTEKIGHDIPTWVFQKYFKKFTNLYL